MRKYKLFYFLLLLLILPVGCKKEPTETTPPLHKAAEEGNIEKFKTLIVSGSKVNEKDKIGRTPLHIAAKFGHKDIAELLINNGASTTTLQ
ncbi:MAG: ankyrin repeat domain-containing protein [Planctomycetes bacterium]|nr:ankyrin repeat domain-containing protein [Planctomycetota bacterium]